MPLSTCKWVLHHETTWESWIWSSQHCTMFGLRRYQNDWEVRFDFWCGLENSVSSLYHLCVTESKLIRAKWLAMRSKCTRSSILKMEPLHTTCKLYPLHSSLAYRLDIAILLGSLILDSMTHIGILTLYRWYIMLTHDESLVVLIKV